MNKHAKLAIGTFVAVGLLLLLAAQSRSINASAAPDNFVGCPPHLIAPYGGGGGWSSIQVQANFAAAVVTQQNLMVCQYGFGQHPRPFFGIEKPCPSGFRCIAERDGFRLTPNIR